MGLIDVYSDLNAISFLYELLRQRDIETVSISHRVMPTAEDHIEFYCSKPYQQWYIVVADGQRVGMVYLSKRNEIGIDIKKDCRRNGYGAWAVREVIRRHENSLRTPDRLWRKAMGYSEGPVLANINPKNTASLEMFRSIGFIDFQVTLRYNVAQEISDGADIRGARTGL
jgi:hypothetical protein